MMREGLKIFLGTIGGWVPQKWLIYLSKQDLILPFYHTVSNDPMPHVSYTYPVRTMKHFRSDLEFLLKHYEPVGLDDLLSYTPNVKRAKPAMFLSFDDGLSEIYHLAAPVLLSKGIPAAVFVNTDFIDNRDLFYRYKSSLLLERFESINYSPPVTEILQRRYYLASPMKKCVRDFLLSISYKNRHELDEVAKLVDLDFRAFLKVKKPYMSMDQIKDLAEKGFYIGSHSKDHPRFGDISPQKRLTQYRESMEYLQKNQGTEYGLFSFPFSDAGVPGNFFNEIRKEGMPRLDASFGSAGLKNDPVAFHYQRIPMEAGRAGAGRLIRGEYLYYLAKSIAGKNTISRI